MGMLGPAPFSIFIVGIDARAGQVRRKLQWLPIPKGLLPQKATAPKRRGPRRTTRFARGLVAGRSRDLLGFIHSLRRAGIRDAGEGWAGGRFDLLHRTDLHHRRLRLLEYHLLVDGPNLSGLFEGLAAAYLVLLRRGHRNIVLLGTNP